MPTATRKKPAKSGQTLAGLARVKRQWNGFLKGRTIVRLLWEPTPNGRLVGFVLDDKRKVYITDTLKGGMFTTEVDMNALT